MSKAWYPMINYEKCVECGACITKCHHGVYDKTSPIPMVISPDNCVHQCTGCASLCPADAIEYFGNQDVNAGISCGCDGGSCGCRGKC